MTYQLTPPSTDHVRLALANSQPRMLATTQAYLEAVDHIGDLHSHTITRAITTLAGTAVLCRAAELQGAFTPGAKQEVYDMTRAYLKRLEGVNVAHGNLVLALAAHAADGR